MNSKTHLEKLAVNFSVWAFTGKATKSSARTQRFLASAEKAGYIFDASNYEINGYSIRNCSDQLAQFAESVRINEADTRRGV